MSTLGLGIGLAVLIAIIIIVGLVLAFYKWLLEFTAGETKSKIVAKVEEKNKLVMAAKDSTLKNTIDGYEFKLKEQKDLSQKQFDDAQLELKIVHAQKDELQAKLDSEADMSKLELIDGDPIKE